MPFWERSVANVFHAVRLNSVKSRVLVFALLATVIPSLTTVQLSYSRNRELLLDKVTVELSSISSHGARETDLWLKERFYDVRVFSNSCEVWENVEAIQRAGARNVSDDNSQGRLETYLEVVRDRFDDYGALTVLGSEGEVLVRTGSLTRLNLPDDWLERVAIGEEVRGDSAARSRCGPWRTGSTGLLAGTAPIAPTVWSSMRFRATADRSATASGFGPRPKP